MKTKTTDTPRTDEEWDWANADGGERFEAVDADFARELERELAEAKALQESETKCANEYHHKLDKLEREIARLKKRVDILEAAHRQIVAISHDARAVDISESALPNAKSEPRPLEKL